LLIYFTFSLVVSCITWNVRLPLQLGDPEWTQNLEEGEDCPEYDGEDDEVEKKEDH
jgi:hypothetical protein